MPSSEQFEKVDLLQGINDTKDIAEKFRVSNRIAVAMEDWDLSADTIAQRCGSDPVTIQKIVDGNVSTIPLRVINAVEAAVSAQQLEVQPSRTQSLPRKPR